MQRDIRKWFMKPHDKGTDDATKSVQPATKDTEKKPQAAESKPETPVQENPRRKTSKYFDKDRQKPKDVKDIEVLPTKRKAQDNGDHSVKPPPSKKAHKDAAAAAADDDDFVDVTPSKKLKSGSGRGVAQKAVDNADNDEDDKDAESPLKSTGRGRGGRGGSSASTGGRARGGGRGGFMNFGERKDPPHKGEKEVPEGSPNCLAGLTFVISGTLDSLEREEAEDLIKRHGGRVTGSISKKTNYLLCDEDIGGQKSKKAKELGTKFLTEDGLFDMIRSSNANIQVKKEEKEAVQIVASQPKKTPQRAEAKSPNKSLTANMSRKISTTGASPAKKKEQTMKDPILPWTEKYRPKAPNEIVGNQSLVNQLHTWLKNWNQQFLNKGDKGKGKKQIDSSAKKAVLLSGTPGIGKTSAAKVVGQMLGFQAIEVNASDSRGKAVAKINKGIGGSNANGVKESINNETIFASMKRVKIPKTVLIMDEVDGMSAGDRGGVADLIDSIKKSKIPVICICNDRYSQKLKSLLNYCLLLSFRKPTKQQMAKRLMQIATAEGLKVNEIALEELADRVNGDMRMALNQLQYMSLSMSAINYDDIRQRLASSRKDEDISPFTAVDKLFGFNGSKLRMDERIDLGMSDVDLVPLIIQENYINYRPSSVTKDDNGMKRMRMLARAADSIADGDIINVQIRRYQQWQLSPSSCVASSVIPAALLHGSRKTFEPGERNFNRFGGWLGKNSTMGKNYRLLEDLHLHLLASRESILRRETLRLEYNTLLVKQLIDPLRLLPKDEGVEKVVEFMNTYSISQEDTETILELSKFQGHANPMEGIPSAVKAALTRAYKGSSRMIRSSDLVPLPGIKKAPTKRIAAMLEPSDIGLAEEDGDALEEENSDEEDLEGLGAGEKLQSELDSLKAKGVKVEMELKSNGTKSAARGRGKVGSSSAEKKPAGRGRGRGDSSASKRKR